jgi:hypothetical protein
LVKLAPTYGGLTYAIFSDGGLDIENKFTDNGSGGNNGDVYTNGDFTMKNNTVIGGTVYAGGKITIDNGIVKADVWGKGNVALTSISVFGKVTASDAASTITLATTHVYGAARAGSTITTANSTVDGGMVPNSPSAAPPSQPFPILLWNAGDWAGYTINTFNDCTAAKTFISSLPVGNQVVRIQAACEIKWGNNDNIDVRGNLAIITDGSVTTENQVNFNGVGGTWTVFMIRPYQVGLACGGAGQYDINVSNHTSFNNMVVGAYTQCTINFANNNSGGAVGQLVGGTVNITNQMTLNYNPVIFPNGKQQGSQLQIAYLREIAG